MFLSSSCLQDKTVFQNKTVSQVLLGPCSSVMQSVTPQKRALSSLIHACKKISFQILSGRSVKTTDTKTRTKELFSFTQATFTDNPIALASNACAKSVYLAHCCMFLFVLFSMKPSSLLCCKQILPRRHPHSYNALWVFFITALYVYWYFS